MKITECFFTELFLFMIVGVTGIQILECYSSPKLNVTDLYAIGLTYHLITELESPFKCWATSWLIGGSL